PVPAARTSATRTCSGWVIDSGRGRTCETVYPLAVLCTTNGRPAGAGLPRVVPQTLLAPLLAVTQRVQAAGHEPLQGRLVPGIEEVRVARVLAAGGDHEPGAAGARIGEVDLQRRHRDRMVGRALPARRVRQVALVVGRVEVDAVPAVREGDVQGEPGPPRVRAGRDGALRPDPADRPAVPGRDVQSLRRGRLGV